MPGPNGGELAPVELTEKQRAEAIAMMVRQRGGHAISDVSAMLGGDGRYVLLMCAGTRALPVLFHGMTPEQALAVIRAAYQDASRLVVAPAAWPPSIEPDG